MTKDSLRCTKCDKEIGEDEGFYNDPTGVKCNQCGDIITIGKYEIPREKINEYRKTVKYLRRATTISIGRDDPLVIQKALVLREKIHREIFKIVGLPYSKDSDNVRSLKFNEQLQRFLL